MAHDPLRQERREILSLKKHGLAFLEDAIEIDNRAYDDYLKVVDSNKHNFKKLNYRFKYKGCIVFGHVLV